MTKNITTGLSLISLSLAMLSSSHAEPLDTKQIQQLGPVSQFGATPLSNSSHGDALRANLAKQLSQSSKAYSTFGDEFDWQQVKTSDKAGWVAYKLPVTTTRFTSGTLNVSGLTKPQIYVNGQLVKSANEAKLSLANGEHQILVLADGLDSDKALSFDWKGEGEFDVLTPFNGKKQRVSAEQMFDATTITNVLVSPNGKLLLSANIAYTPENSDTPVQAMELTSLSNNQVIYRWQSNRPSSPAFSPDSKQLAFVADGQIQLLDVNNLNVTTLAQKLEGVSGLNWHKNSLLFSWQKTYQKDKSATAKHYQSLEDRWSYWRNNSQLYQIDVTSGAIRQLTDNAISSNFVDVNSDKGTILLARYPVDYAKPAHGLSQLVELNLKDLSETLIGEYRTFSGAMYGDDGMYIVAGANFMDGLGKQDANIEVNDYEGQLYWRKNKGEVSALSKNFDPAIGGMTILDDNDVLLSVTEGDRAPLYVYDSSKKRFNSVDTGVDMVNTYSVSKGSKPSLVFAGTSATVPQKMVSMSLSGSSKKVLFDSAKTDFANTKLGEIKDFDVTNKHGHNIDGRVYLPVDFDANKQYPALVYYYGGTSPVGRHFTGRWPFNLWAAQGYVVYVLQPNGATGYGQAFSGRHVNAWGEYSSDDIIEGTQAFLKAHPFVDAKRVGNMGASYGGFMTMYLATQTDMFAASMSHAGISNIASYWGQGWWGYGYSGVASRGSFPWNNKDLYVEHSPLYHADKITTPLLLIHGDADTNVPVGESHAMYTALKLLDKEVELVEFYDQDHHINARKARFDWWDTTIAWFDLHLKGEPQWWNSLYPESKKADSKKPE